MRNIYCTANSVEADAIISKLSDNGINASCRRKDEFGVVTGKNNIEFEIFVDDWYVDKAKELIKKDRHEQTQTPVVNRRVLLRRGTAIVCLVLVLAVIIFSVISSIS